MIQSLFNRNADVVRQTVSDIRSSIQDVTDANIANALAYFQRENDHDLVRDALKRRFAIGITHLKSGGDDLPVSSPGSDNAIGYETYTKSRVAEQIDSGEIEVITSGIGNKVINSLANLFSMPTQSWEYINAAGDKDEDVSELIATLRNASNFENEMCNADWIASAIESCAVLVTWKNDSLSYKAIPPSSIRAHFGEYLTDKGELRSVDKTDIEDATFVSVKLSDCVDNYSTNQYLGIFGKSDVYPMGRYVVYQSSMWDSVPDVGDADALDYRTSDGEIANPLSWYAAKSGNNVPEYPIFIVKGGMVRVTDKFMPVSTSLFENCLEFDIGESRLVKDGLNAARGKDVITNENGVPLPRSLEAAIVMQRGQTLEVTGRPALHSVQALEVVRNIARGVAEGYDVPGYQVMSDDVTELSSGVAIHLRTQPLIKHRDDRVKLNRKSIDKLFHIERALFNIHSEGDIPMDVVQKWNPGRFVEVESELDKNTRLKAAMDNGFISYVRAVRDYHNFPTDADAEAYIERINGQNAENPVPKTRNGSMPFGFQ